MGPLRFLVAQLSRFRAQHAGASKRETLLDHDLVSDQSFDAMLETFGKAALHAKFRGDGKSLTDTLPDLNVG